MSTISATELAALTRSAGEWALFDIREAGEADAGHVPGASFLPRRLLESKLAEFVQDRATTIVVYDEGGARAGLAAAAATRAGYRDVRVLDGGIRAWERAGGAVSSGSNVPSKHFGEEVSVRENVPQLPPQTLHRWQAEGTPHIVCDIRTPEEYRAAHIPRAAGAFGVDVGLSAADLAAEGKPVVVHCAGRTRSIIACQTLRALGVPEVYALEDGTMGWTLAGFELEKGVARGGGPGHVLEPSPESIRHMTERARALGEDAGVTAVSGQRLSDWLDRRAAGEMNVYLFDVRQVPRYEEGHVRGARALPGGLAIQRTDEFVAVKNAHIVLVEDDEARAWMTGYWLARMGFPNVHVLAGGLGQWGEEGRPLERGRSRSTPLLLEETRRATTSVAPAELHAQLLAGTQPALIDVDTSKYFADRHLPGARWIPYGSLEARIGAAVPALDGPLVVTCHNGVHSTFAAANLARLGYTNVQVLDGGTDLWAKAGLPIEQGLGDATPDDIVVPPYNSTPEAMAKYLEWEKKLTR